MKDTSVFANIYAWTARWKKWPGGSSRVGTIGLPAGWPLRSNTTRPATLHDLSLAQGVTTQDRYGLFGHSAGGQFVHRMLSFGFRDRVAVAISSNAGTYAMSNLVTPWPFGLGQTVVDDDALRALLEFPPRDGGH